MNLHKTIRYSSFPDNFSQGAPKLVERWVYCYRKRGSKDANVRFSIQLLPADSEEFMAFELEDIV